MEKETKTKNVETVKKIIRKKKAPVRFTHITFFLFKLLFSSRLWVKSVFLGFRRFIFH